MTAAFQYVTQKQFTTYLRYIYKGRHENRLLHPRRVEVDHLTVLQEHVHLLDARDVVHAEALQLSLQLLIVGAIYTHVYTYICIYVYIYIYTYRYIYIYMVLDKSRDLWVGPPGHFT